MFVVRTSEHKARDAFPPVLPIDFAFYGHKVVFRIVAGEATSSRTMF
jgi:hypothetical protein